MDELLLRKKLEAVLPHLDERHRRLFVAAEARALGHGGVSKVARVARVARVAGVARAPIRTGLAELDQPPNPASPPGRLRRPGGGRKRLRDRDPDVVATLEILVCPEVDPPLRWTCQGTRNLAEELGWLGHRVSHIMVAELLRQEGYHLQPPGTAHGGPDLAARNAQFRHVGQRVREWLATELPVLAVDCVKVETRSWEDSEPEAPPRERDENPERPVAGRDAGAETAGPFHWQESPVDEGAVEVAADTVARWWNSLGRTRFPRAGSLLLCASGAGSPHPPQPLWAPAVAALADRLGLEVSVSHLPQGTYRWVRAGHRLSSRSTRVCMGSLPVRYEATLLWIEPPKEQVSPGSPGERAVELTSLGDAGSNPDDSSVDCDVDLPQGGWNYTVRPTWLD